LADIETTSAASPIASIDAFRILADTVPQIVWIAGADGGIEYFNRQWWDYTGLTWDQVRGEGWTIPMHPDDRQRCSERWAQSLSSGEQYEIEYRFRRARDGEYRWFLGRACPYRNEAKQILRWFGTCTDIHDQKSAEEALRHAKEESERLSRAKDEFLSILSHELRTPLSAILGWTQLLEMDVLDEAERKEAVQTITQQAKVQSQLIEDLLEVSRILNGKFHMRQQVMALCDVVKSAIDNVTPAAVGRRIGLHCDDWDDTIYVRGDPQRMQQLAWNLLTNAVKFSLEGGRVDVDVHRVGSHVELSVRDAGKGIPPALLEGIFHRFKQVDSSYTRAHGGLGLGLSIADHIARMHGGSISAASEGEGRGATFTVRMPLLAVQPAGLVPVGDKPRAAVGADALAGRDMLVVDDEESARNVVATCLRSYGADVHTASSVAEAIELLEHRRFSAILSDIAMPAQDGFALVRHIRGHASEALRTTPAVALTAFASVDDQSRALGAGFDVHVTKPVDPVELIRQLLGVLDPASKQS